MCPTPVEKAVQPVDSPCWVLFDFDGVIADSEAAIMMTIKEMADARGWPMVSIQALQNESTRTLMRRWKIRFWQVPGLLRTARRKILQHGHLVQPHPNVMPALAFARENALRLAIVTSNTPALVEAFLASHLPQVPFAVVRGDVSLFGKHRAIKKVLRAQHIAPDRAVYVGDEVRDVVAARRAGLRACAVTWGKERETVLLDADPAWLARDGEELRRAIAEACGLI